MGLYFKNPLEISWSFKVGANAGTGYDLQEVDRLWARGAGKVDKLGDGFFGRFGGHDDGG